MPVKIVSSNPTAEQITASDLKKMKDDFINEADVKPYNGRETLIKKFSVSVMKNELKALIAYYEDAQVIKINFAIHVNPFLACSGDYSDSLTTVVEAATFINSDYPELGHISHTTPDVDYVVIPGHRCAILGEFGGDSPCCPSSNP